MKKLFLITYWASTAAIIYLAATSDEFILSPLGFAAYSFALVCLAADFGAYVEKGNKS